MSKVSDFSFSAHAPFAQSPDETLHLMMSELGHVAEYHHKAKRYGVAGYSGNEKKEMSDLVSMCRYYCEQKGWDFYELMAYGEACYLERMEDLKKRGIKPRRTNEYS